MVSFYPRIIVIHPEEIAFENTSHPVLRYFLVFLLFYLVIFISEVLYFLSLFLMHDISICKFSSLKLHIFDHRH